MKIHDVAQLSPEWWSLRAGVPTASEMKRIITAKDAKGSKGMIGYAAELAADLQCQSPAYFTQKNRPINRHQEYGRDMEEEARNWYAFDRGVEVVRAGFITTDDGRFGCSPDFLIRENGQWVGGGEIKCVEAHKHARFVLKETLPLEYRAQVAGCLIVTGLPYWDWISYCPPMTPLVVRVVPDKFTEALKVQMEVFWAVYQEVKAKLGITKKEPEQMTDEGKQALADWKEFISSRPALEAFNEQLPKLKGAGTGKRDAWNAIKEYAASQHWVFDGKALVFREEEAAVNF